MSLAEVKDLGDGSCQLEFLGAGLVPSLSDRCLAVVTRPTL